MHCLLYGLGTGMRRIPPCAFGSRDSCVARPPILCPWRRQSRRVGRDYSLRHAKQLEDLFPQRVSRRSGDARGTRCKNRDQLQETTGKLLVPGNVYGAKNLTAHPSKSGMIHVFNSEFGRFHAHITRSLGAFSVGVSSISIMNSTFGMVVGSGIAMIARYRLERPEIARARSHIPCFSSIMYI
jgi:hypothetical protein